MAEIKRIQTNKRMTQIVIHNGTVYLSGQLGTPGTSIERQMHDTLARIDELLGTAGTDRAHLLQAEIWLSSMDDFEIINSIWDEWVPEGHAPARLCGGVSLATPEYRVEITVIAALP